MRTNPEVAVNAVPHNKFLHPWNFDPECTSDLAIIICDPSDLDRTPMNPDGAPERCLFVAFDDEEDFDQPDTWPITEGQAALIAGFVMGAIATSEASKLHITVSCPGGTCRSAAVACAIDAWCNGTAHAASQFLLVPDFLPNRLVFNMVLEAFCDEPVSGWETFFKKNRELFDREHNLVVQA